jgi:PAS domain S-box-containing protein
MISVLFVDDESVQLAVGKKFLEKTGDFSVDTLGSAREALASENLFRYDAIVSDYLMPGIDGIKLLQQIRSSGNTVPFILFTGKGREEIVIQALDEGADFYVKKGVQADTQYAELGHKIRTAVKRQQHIRTVKAGEQALRESEQRFRALFENANDAITVLGFTPDGPPSRFTDVNENACRISGYAREELLSMSPEDLDDPEEWPEARRYTQKIREQGHLVFERTLVRKDGKKVPVEISSHTFILNNQNLMLSIFRDITERKRAEKALRESEEKYRSLADAAEDLIYIIDRDDRVVYVNRFGLEMLKKSEREVIGKPRNSLFPDPVAARQYQNIREVFTRGIPLRIESQIPLPGHETWQDTHLVPLKSAGGAITAVMGVSRDITERRRAEDALRENLERYHLILKNANEGILVNELTPEGPGTFLEANEAACRILGITSEEMQNLRLADLDTPEMKSRYPEIMREIQQTRHAIFQTSYKTKDNIEKFIEISVSLFELGGRPTILSVVRDITGQKKADLAIRIANKKLSLLTSITRHDIRNQLLALNAYLFLSKDTLGDPDKTAGYIRNEEGITRAIEHQILFTKEYENLGVNAPVWQNVQQCIEHVAREHDLTGVDLVVENLETVEIFADSLLQKVFFNLADNSLRHGGTALTQIRFSHRETENGLILLCEDDGSGIPDDEKEIIFERGYGKNTGFGLFFIGEILAITGITIQECGVPDRGARFEILVPKGEYRFKGQE